MKGSRVITAAFVVLVLTLIGTVLLHVQVERYHAQRETAAEGLMQVSAEGSRLVQSYGSGKDAGEGAGVATLERKVSSLRASLRGLHEGRENPDLAASLGSLAEQVQGLKVAMESAARPEEMLRRTADLSQAAARAENLVDKAIEGRVGWMSRLEGAMLFVTFLGVVLAAFLLQWRVFRPLSMVEAYAREPNGEWLALGRGVARGVAAMGAAVDDMHRDRDRALENAERELEALRAEKRALEEPLRRAEEQERMVAALMKGMKDAASRAGGVSEGVFGAVEEMNGWIERVNRGIEVHHSRMGQVSEAMDEMNVASVEVARNSGGAARSAESARTLAGTGADRVREALDAISAMQRRVLELRDTMGELGHRAEAIGRIMDVINDIADQTNLLALNAAIEAARAGEAGRGFAVVADEVRKLAEKTMGATKEVGDAVQAMQSQARTSIAGVEEVGRQMEGTAAAAEGAGGAMGEIVGVVEQTSMQVGAIATAAEQQAAGLESISEAIGEISRVAGETAESMRQCTRALQGIGSRMEELDTVVQSMAEGRVGLAGGGDKLFEWDDALNIGVADVDPQHKVLVDLINEVYAAMKAGADRSVLQDIVRRLREYTVKHFTYEEGVLHTSMRYPDMQAHLKQHRAFVERIAQFEEALGSGRVTLDMEMMRFLKNWLKQHIMGTDKKYVPYFNGDGTPK
ncbi:MAG TPA: chemotaxis protein [Desulfovibrio sp.]|nr:chemotaxis protein [Desulfovibrio sp.]